MAGRKFWKIYGVFAAVCVVLGSVFLIYVATVVSQYDAAQPEKLVEAKLAQLKEDAVKAEILPELESVSTGSEKYEDIDLDGLKRDYTQTLKNAALSYEIKAGEGKDLTKVYTVFADKKAVGTMTLSGTNERTGLFFFSMADWSITEFSPILTDTMYNLSLYLPEGMKVTINGAEPDENELVGNSAEGIPMYEIKGLSRSPDIAYYNSDGADVSCKIENNTVTPLPYHYRFTLPEGVTVTVNGKTAKSAEKQGELNVFDVGAMTKPEVIFTDCCGGSIQYSGESSVDVNNYSICVPEGFRVSVNGADIDEKYARRTEKPEKALLKQLVNVELPDMMEYSVPLFSSSAAAVITDSSGASAQYTLTEKPLTVSSPFSSADIPESISSQLDVIYVAESWSKFVTDDLEGGSHGFDTITKYLIKDSDYYAYAQEWVTGIDITFTSSHEITAFANESISNFAQYSDNCFSCDVYFEKQMALYSGGAYVGSTTDVFNSTMYFVYYDDTPDNGTDDPHWAIAAMRDVQ